MLTRLRVGGALAVLTAAAILGGAPGAVAAGGPCTASCGGGSAGGSAGGGTIVVTVTGSGVTAGGDSVPIDAKTIAQHPLCWYNQFMTGKAYAEYVDSGEAHAHDHNLGEPVEDIPGYEEHADDDKGHWYSGECSSAYWKDGKEIDGFGDAATAWFTDHPTVWVDAGDPPPEPLVTPEMLAEIAMKAMNLAPGEIHWNPTRTGDGATFVGMPTWVWLDGPTAVNVTASVYGGALWARVDASVDELHLSAPGATSATCGDTGTPWSAGASTDCAITFDRSSANQPVVGDHDEPTSRLSAEAVWTASWVSSLGGGATTLPDQTVTSTADVPVAEVQSIVTGS
ncbi:hypothetical protein [Cellulomonas sp. PhB150]|uniref:hypothetical protein n=1 Tax=Cellulomonas sp. PhB150 TaxID=2485188 RepID=UPI000F4729B2|nr:hypothetical protein [Cellulomonas sp. PhB150]ROS30714.1 hypothetical protein EDF34_0353 [Cellulomonas sp. PhB150]